MIRPGAVRTVARRLAQRVRPRPPASWRAIGARPGRVVAFSEPDYLGVTRSTRSFFADWIPLRERDLWRPGDARGLAEAVAASGCAAVVFSGFAPGYARAIEALGRRAPELPVFVLWHGNVLQNTEECSWRHLGEVVALARRGRIRRVGCFHAGLPALLERAGVSAAFVMNRPERIPARASTPRGDGRIHLGIWSAGESWRKNPHATIGAAALVERAVLSGLLDPRARAWAAMLGVTLGRVVDAPLPRERLEEELASAHCNLYVTLSECSPLLPLESLGVGAPCLIGPNSHLFREEGEAADALRRALIVERVDEPADIAAAIRRVVAMREEVIAAYRVWAPEQERRARAAMEALLERKLELPDAP